MDVERVNLAKRALALMILIKPQRGESLEDFVRRAETEIRMISVKEKESVSQ